MEGFFLLCTTFLMHITCVAWLLSNIPMQFLKIHLLPYHVLYSKRSTQGSSAWQHRAGHWWFLTPRRTHWPSEALSCCISCGSTVVESALSCLNCPRTILEHVWWKNSYNELRIASVWNNRQTNYDAGALESNTIKHYQNTNDCISLPFSLLPASPHNLNGYAKYMQRIQK